MTMPSRPVAPEMSRLALQRRVVVRAFAGALWLALAVLVAIAGARFGWWTSSDGTANGFEVTVALCCSIGGAAVCLHSVVAAYRTLLAARKLGTFLDARAFVVSTVRPGRPVIAEEITEACYLALYDVDDEVRAQPLGAVAIRRMDARQISEGRVVAVYGTVAMGNNIVVAWERNVIDQATVIALPPTARPFVSGLDAW
jgi:hypothetical protein